VDELWTNTTTSKRGLQPHYKPHRVSRENEIPRGKNQQITLHILQFALYAISILNGYILLRQLSSSHTKQDRCSFIMSLQTYHLRNLFGGAIVAEIRSNWMDTSEYRQVPDDQEVFQDPESHLSMQIDLCQRVEDAGGEDDVFRFHAENLIEEGGDMRLSSITQVSLAKFP
jgi:hypothetical protein